MTLNQFVNIARNFKNQSGVLKGFFVGPFDQYGHDKGKSLPVLVMTVQPTTIGEITKTFRATFNVLAVVDGLDQLLEIQSDTEMICWQLISAYDKIEDSLLTLPIEVQHVDYTVDKDLLGGSFFELSLEVKSGLEECVDPIPAQMGAEIIDQDGEVIAVLYPGQSYTVEVLRQIIQTLTDPAPATIIQTLS